MKKIYVMIILFILSFKSNGQTYTLLTNDPVSDMTQPFAPDIQSLGYRTDIAQDSIWFRVQTYGAVDPNGDVGLMFGLDTNLITTDGIVWNGSNHSMHYDQAFLVFQDFISPHYYGYLYYNGGSRPIATNVLRPDSFTFIINTKLSELTINGNPFNLLFGSGAFDILSTRDVFDDAPNSGFMTVNPLTGTRETNLVAPPFSFYPNPTKGILTIHNQLRPWKILHYSIFSPTGSEIKQGFLHDQETIDLANVKPGIYFLRVTDEDGISQTSIVTKINDGL